MEKAENVQRSCRYNQNDGCRSLLEGLMDLFRYMCDTCLQTEEAIRLESSRSGASKSMHFWCMFFTWTKIQPPFRCYRSVTMSAWVAGSILEPCSIYHWQSSKAPCARIWRLIEHIRYASANGCHGRKMHENPCTYFTLPFALSEPCNCLCQEHSYLLPNVEKHMVGDLSPRLSRCQDTCVAGAVSSQYILNYCSASIPLRNPSAQQPFFCLHMSKMSSGRSRSASQSCTKHDKTI